MDVSEITNTDFHAGRQERSPDRVKVVKIALATFLPAFALSLAISAAILIFSDNAEMMAYQNAERHTVAIQSVSIDRDIAAVSADLAILVHGRMTERLWGDEGNPIQDVLADLSEDYLNVSMYRVSASVRSSAPD